MAPPSFTDFSDLHAGDNVHRRYNPLTGRHILVSPHRNARPWNGRVEPPAVVDLPEYAPECSLCPRNTRAGGKVNPDYKAVFAFPNDFPALLPPPSEGPGNDAAGCCEPVFGQAKVICFHPRHDLTLARMTHEEIGDVLTGWQDAYEEEGRAIRGMLRQTGDEDGYIQIFENRGAMMGCSAPHPHGQVWSMTYVPDEPAVEMNAFARYGAKFDHHLLLAYARAELKHQDRVVAYDEQSGWLAVVPFWATWPFETLVLPSHRQIPSISQMTSEEEQGLARILKLLLVRLDNLFSCSFPYSMGIHQSPLPPTAGEAITSSSAQLHFHFYPPLLRSAVIRKFMVGFELSGEAQRDITPEQAASRIRQAGDVHYTEL